MSYIEIPSSWIDIGQPTKKELFDYIRANQIDHESRISTTEAATVQTQVFEREVVGSLQLYGVKNGAFYGRLQSTVNLLAGRIIQFETSGSGTFQVDIKYKHLAGPWTSVFAIYPSVTVANGAPYASINGVLAVTTLSAGDLLRIDFLSIQTNTTQGHWVIGLEYENA